MKRGDKVQLKRGKTRKWCEVVHDHSIDDPPFPAVTVDYNSANWIVGTHEIVSAEEIEAERAAKRQEQEDSVADIVREFKAGNDTMRKLAVALNKQMIDILSRVRKAQRLGLIKLVKESK